MDCAWDAKSVTEQTTPTAIEEQAVKRRRTYLEKSFDTWKEVELYWPGSAGWCERSASTQSHACEATRWRYVRG